MPRKTRKSNTVADTEEVTRKAIDVTSSCDSSQPSSSSVAPDKLTTGRGTSRKRPIKDTDDVEEESVTKRAKSAKTEGKSTGTKVVDNAIKTVVVKGKAPVDPECPLSASAHVYSVGSDIYDVMLNQTNVGNNNNKYYAIQLLESDQGKKYSVWNHWGRVGFKGQSSLTHCGSDLEKAMDLFCQKFFSKTKNEWSARNKFVKHSGKYDLVKIDYKAKETKAESQLDKSTPVPESKLCEQLQALIKLICDVKEMESIVMEMKYDAEKAPLGRLTTDQIKAGYAALKRIDVCIKNKDFGGKLIEACNDFYTRIPHAFGMSRPTVIRTESEVKSKLNLLEALGDIEIAMRVLKECKSTENPIDQHYLSLHCELKLMDKTNPAYKVIDKYLTSTHAPTHNQYRMKILDVYEVNREGEHQQFIDCGNRMLLWHGSRITNVVGILSQGLRIAPPEAPVTGYMFGKGIYFADMSSKSANYCFPTRTKNTGLLLLCEVSLGQCRELLDADSDADKLLKGFNSVKGLGKMAPDASQNVVLSDGTIVPVGQPKDTGITNPNGYTLNYNEYIVYSTRQVKMRFAVQVRFEF
jgi:poly [ADP-ribose] polymerase